MEMGAGRVRGVVAVVRDVTEVSELRWRVRRRQGFHNIVGGSPAMQEIFETVRQVSTSDYPVLISGESGTGKELVARAIHAESRRAKGPFVPINCGALPENILESELFGHVRGAFTGAIRDKKGRFELAHKGTLFLDEVGELTQPFQVKLLRVLQEMRFELVGGERSVSVDVRIISATNQDLRQMVQQGSFREDLFYRLCVVPIGMPALRERTQDLPGLVEHFLDGIRQDTGKPIRRVSDEAMDCLLRHRWPGNVRELINALQFAAVRCEGEEILVRHLPPEVRQEEGGLQVRRPEPATPPVQTAPRKRYKLDRESVTRALEEAGGNKVLAAKLLGVGRATLYRFLNREKMN
jgi:transcriptional regulator with PAS, ATPase and Fis domain